MHQIVSKFYAIHDIRMLIYYLIILSIFASSSSSSSSSCPSPSSLSVLPLMAFDLNFTQHNINNNNDNDKTIMITPVQETLDILSKIQTNIVVVSIIGPYRTGKSFLLNQLIPPLSSSLTHLFSVGHSVAPHTEEVSLLLLPPCLLSSSPLSASIPPGSTLLLLDTPGLYAPNRASIFDSELLALLNLVSSAVVYNSFGVVNRNAIEQLNQAIQVAMAMAFMNDDQRNRSATTTTASSTISTSNTSSTTGHIDRPHLIWVMNNLDLDMIDKQGNKQSTKVYIQNILTQIDDSAKGSTGYFERFNKFFSSLDTHALPYPAPSFVRGSRLTNLTENELSVDYKQARDSLRSKLYSLLQPKSLGQDTVTGRTLSTLISTWISTMNMPASSLLSGSSSSSSSSALLDHIHKIELAKAVSSYKDKMKDITFPIDDSSLLKKHLSAQESILFGVSEVDMPHFIQSVKKETNGIYSTFISLNEDRIDSDLLRLYDALSSSLSARLSSLLLTLPFSGSSLDSLVSSVKQEWLVSVEYLKQVQAASSKVSAYDAKVAKTIMTEVRRVCERNAEAHANRLIDELKTALNHLSLPVEERVIDDVQDKYIQEWKTLIKTKMDNHDGEFVEKATTTVMSQINIAIEAHKASNKLISINQCKSEASARASGLLARRSEWLQSTGQAFRSRQAFIIELNRVREQTPLCVGPGLNSSVVSSYFVHVVDDYFSTILLPRIQLSRNILYAIISFATWSLFRLPHYYRAVDFRSLPLLSRSTCVLQPLFLCVTVFIYFFVPDAVARPVHDIDDGEGEGEGDVLMMRMRLKMMLSSEVLTAVALVLAVATALTLLTIVREIRRGRGLASKGE